MHQAPANAGSRKGLLYQAGLVSTFGGQLYQLYPFIEHTYARLFH